MRTKAILLVSIFLIILGLAWISAGVQAAPGDPQTAYPSPTPQPDGRIIYIVQAGDSCDRISILYGVSMDYLRNCWVAQLGTTEAQSTFMRKRVIPADVGYFIFRANQASTGEINRFQHRFVPYMVRGFNFDPRAYTIRE